MKTTDTPCRFQLEPSDFIQNQDGSTSITLPQGADYSFSRNGSLSIPTSISYPPSPSPATFTFAEAPDILYAHLLVNGTEGRLLPALDATIASSILSQKHTTPLPPRGKNNPRQEENLPDTGDSTITKATVGGRTAWSRDTGHATSTPRIACENQSLRSIMFFATIVETDPHDPLAIVEPVGVEFQLGVNGGSEAPLPPIVMECGGGIVKESWNVEGGVRERVELPDGGWRWSSIWKDGLGWQYGRAGGKVEIWRSVDGCYSDSIEYLFRLELGELELESLPPVPMIRMRYSTGTDVNGNFIWRGWSVGVGFIVNSKPLPPVFNGVERSGVG